MICVTYCCKCKNRMPKIDGWRSCCKAFPDGIPVDFDYSKVGDTVECNNGIGFEQDEKDKPSE